MVWEKCGTKLTRLIILGHLYDWFQYPDIYRLPPYLTRLQCSVSDVSLDLGYCQCLKVLQMASVESLVTNSFPESLEKVMLLNCHNINMGLFRPVVFSHLKTLHIHSAFLCTIFRHVPHLKKLYVLQSADDPNNVLYNNTCIAPCLQKLTVSVPLVDPDRLIVFPHLRELTLNNVPLYSTMLPYLSNLKSLTSFRYRRSSSRWLAESSTLVEAKLFPSCLQEIEFEHCPNLVFDRSMRTMSVLQCIKMTNCGQDMMRAWKQRDLPAQLVTCHVIHATLYCVSALYETLEE
jgi:hypothetical protein